MTPAATTGEPRRFHWVPSETARSPGRGTTPRRRQFDATTGHPGGVTRATEVNCLLGRTNPRLTRPGPRQLVVGLGEGEAGSSAGSSSGTDEASIAVSWSWSWITGS